jgi:AraC-like DNA-binding protein/quercetin dioxygenase-like cupin family protein
MAMQAVRDGSSAMRSLSGTEGVWREAAVIALRGGFFACEPSWRLEERTRPHYQLWLATGGSACLTVAGQEYPLSAGTALLVPPLAPHAGTHDPAQPLRCYVLHFAVRVLGAAAPGALDALPRVSRPDAALWEKLVAAAEEVCAELAAGRPGAALLAGAAMARAVGLLWRAAAEQHARVEPPARTAPAQLEAVFTYLATHYAEPVTLARLARLANLSPAHFSTVFRRATGLSPFQYVQRLRLQRARELLAATDEPVAQVAAQAGFADPFYFSRAFKRLEGLSPTQYRRAVRAMPAP